MNAKRIVAILAIAAVITLVYWPTLRWLFHSWISNPYYSHGFLVPVVSGFFVWVKRKELRGGEPSIVGAFVVTLGVFLYIMAFVWAVRFLSAISLPIVLTGLSLSSLGVRPTRAIAFPIVFLIFMIPLPPIQELGYSLQEVSVRSSAWVLDVLGMSVSTVGPEIHLGDAVFTIGLACSGINSLIALLALGAVYSFVLDGPLYKRVIVLVAAFPIAMLSNVLRIVSIILVANYWGVDAASGLFHDVSSPLFFVLAFLALILFGRVLGCKFGLAASNK